MPASPAMRGTASSHTRKGDDALDAAPAGRLLAEGVHRDALRDDAPKRRCPGAVEPAEIADRPAEIAPIRVDGAHDDLIAKHDPLHYLRSEERRGGKGCR